MKHKKWIYALGGFVVGSFVPLKRVLVVLKGGK